MTALGVQYLLEGEADIVFVGSARSESEAAQYLRDGQIDIVLLDPGLPGLGDVGIDRWLAECEPTTHVILLVGREEASYAQQALQGGVRGYVLKRSPAAVLLQAIRATLAGGVYLDPAAVEHLILAKRQTASRSHVKLASSTHLTDREREVFRLIAFGYSHKEIAGRLGITSKSVETYKMRASEKLDIRTRAKIVQYAMLQGWLQDMIE